MSPSHNSEQEFFKLLQSCGFLSTEKIQAIHKKFQTYQQVIQKINNKFNLISHNDLNKIWIRHFFDSVIPIKLFTNEFKIIHNAHSLSLAQEVRMKGIDIGTGAGFPGLPIGLVCTELSLTLVDSIQKKYRFLKNILIPSLGVHRETTVICIRAEELAHQNEHREQYDFAFARALAKPLLAMELLLPFVKIGGHACFWASGQEWSEQRKIEKQAQLLGAEISKREIYFLPGDDKKREIFLLKKVSQTDPLYELTEMRT